MARSSTLIAAGLTLAGTLLVIWLVRSVGLTEVLAGFGAIGSAGFAGVLVLSLLRYTARSYAWTTLIVPPPGHSPVPLKSAVAATLGGEALGNLSFLSLLVSEPAKALYVTRHVPADEALGALTSETFFYSVSVALVILAGTLTLLGTFVLPEDWRTAAFAALGLMGAILLVATWLVWQRPGFTTRFSFDDSRWYGRLHQRLSALEAITYRGLRTSPWRLMVVVGCEVAFHVLSIIESWLILYLLTGQSQWLNAFLFDTLNRVINVVFRMVPLKVAVDEFSASGLAELIGLGNATGLTMALIRKARVLTWVAIGLALLGLRSGKLAR